MKIDKQTALFQKLSSLVLCLIGACCKKTFIQLLYVIIIIIIIIIINVNLYSALSSTKNL